jgi:hypothetical protein
VPARWNETPDGKRVEVVPFSENETARLNEAHSVLRDLATRMKAFAHNETWVTRALALFRYDPHLASDGLFGLSNDIGMVGIRARWRQTISDALRIPKNIL